MFINGKFVESKTDTWIDLHNPVRNGTVVVYAVLACVCKNIVMQGYR